MLNAALRAVKARFEAKMAQIACCRLVAEPFGIGLPSCLLCSRQTLDVARVALTCRL